MVEQTGMQKGRETIKASTAMTEESFIQVWERERRNLRKKITITLKKLQDCTGRSGSKTFIRNQSRELEEMGRTWREVNDDLCDHYYEDMQAVEQQELQIEYTGKIKKKYWKKAQDIYLNSRP